MAYDDGLDDTDEMRVPLHHGCPTCGERHVDALRIDEASVRRVKDAAGRAWEETAEVACVTCGQRYTIREG